MHYGRHADVHSANGGAAPGACETRCFPILSPLSENVLSCRMAGIGLPLAAIPRRMGHAAVADGPPGGVDTTEDTMDAVCAVLLFLTGLNAVVWWCVWQRRPWRLRWHWAAWLRGRMWWHLAGFHSAVWALVWRLHRWAQRRPGVEAHPQWPAPPCALCGDARHTAQEHVRLPQRELERRAGRQDAPEKGP